MLKIATTYKQQISKLKDEHNLIINNEDKAIEILKKINYYRLSGYGVGLKQENNSDKYIDGITIEHIFKLYCFDSLLRNNILKSIEQIEVQLRTNIINLHANKYGPEGYRNPATFVDYSTKKYDSIYNKTFKHIDSMIKKQSHLPFIKHYIKNYDAHFPLWVALEVCSFGNLSYIFTLLHKEDQKEIAKIYDTTPKYLHSWIISLVEIRNICAHYNRLYNMPLKNTPLLYS